MTVGVDTWVTVAEADNYLTNRINATSWFGLSTTAAPGALSKETLLVSAQRTLLFSTGGAIPLSTTDGNVKKAQIETAYFLQNYFEELESIDVAQSAGVASFEFSKRKETFTGATVNLPSFITGLISDFITEGGNFVDLMAGLSRP